MCRNIRTLYHLDPPCTEEEIAAATLQFVRKVSGFTKPSKRNAAAFERAVEAITENVTQFFSELEVTTPPRDRAVLEERARRRALEHRARESGA